MPECSRGGEEHAHQAEERGRGRGRKDEKRTKEGGRQERSVLQASRSYRGARLSGANLHRTVKNKKKKKKKKKINALCPRVDRRTDHLSLESSEKQTEAHSLTEEQKSWRSVRGLYVSARRKHAHTKYIFSEATLRCRGREQQKYIIAAYETTQYTHEDVWFFLKVIIVKSIKKSDSNTKEAA